MNFKAAPVPLIQIAVGAALLLFGRRVFWLFVAAVGFTIGIYVTPLVVHDPPVWLAVGVALFLGLAGAVFALLLQRIAIAVAGFLGGGRLAVALTSAFMADYAQYGWLTFFVGGIVGALLLTVLFDWALIFLSSFEGAHLITTALQLPERGALILLVLLAAAGVIFQAVARRR